MRNFHKHGIDTRGRISGKVKTICPQCNDTRGHKGNRSLSVDLDQGMCYCHHCGYKLYVPDDAEEREKERRRASRQKAAKLPSHFRRPTFDPARMQLCENLERYWTQERCLPQELLRTLRITEEKVRMPECTQEENCICFNYFENGTLVNTKYRSGLKHFKMVTGAELIPYNVDSILGTPECVITEGEFDAAACMAAGRKDVISVPAGAQSNLTWLDRFIETHFEDKQTIYIAVDEDQAGQLLRQELVRRLGAERCRIVHFGEGCKDGNEHLIKFGAESLRICIEQAEEVPLEGIFTVEDCLDDLRALYENGLQRGADTGWENFDEHCTFEPGRLAVVTGRPGEGKSEFIDELVLRLCLRHEWKIAFFSPENMPLAYHQHKLAEKLTGKRFTPGPGMTEAIYNRTVGWLAGNVSHILPDNGSYTIDAILEKARQVVRRRGARTIVLDPMNRLEQQLEPGQTEMSYITSVLSKLGRFAAQNRCLVILVAHPRKVNRNEKDGTLRRVEMNDINGSANVANMSDFCIDVDRNDEKQIVTIYIDKVRFKHLGSAHTDAKFVFNRVNGRYWPCEEAIVSTPEGEKPGPVNTKFDNKDWLKKSEENMKYSEEQTRLFA
ncbi:DnaB-like helicase C-terminal domain-containing protein [Bacteroides sp.]|uniref:bifunctional DNA primase/helicase n=1 Tax=Bacteroides sp. TaxID=29523 RepID=UPI003AB35468